MSGNPESMGVWKPPTESMESMGVWKPGVDGCLETPHGVDGSRWVSGNPHGVDGCLETRVSFPARNELLRSENANGQVKNAVICHNDVALGQLRYAGC